MVRLPFQCEISQILVRSRRARTSSTTGIRRLRVWILNRSNNKISRLGTETRALTWVAIIDDDEFVRHSLARFFKAAGFSAQVYESADKYANQPLSDLPVCIVLDLQLQTGMSSFEFMDWLNVAGQRVPVILMTGQADLETELCERYPELRETLRKPFDPDRLITRVRDHVKASSRSLQSHDVVN